jgi:hypothetical protein
MEGADASAAPDAIRARGRGRKIGSRARTPSRRDDETTLPRTAGDAGLLMSTTTSESDASVATYAYEPLTATLIACVPST